jgi:hypothetical protein
VPHIVGVVRSKSPLKELETDGILNDSGTKGISHSDSLFLSILARSGFITVPRNEITVKCMANVYDTNNHCPHSKGTVTVDSVFLEISVHFV